MELELICPLEEQEGHTHDESCRTQTLICEQGEQEDHIHEESCFAWEADHICGKEEIPSHAHDESCYVLLEDSFICGQEETGGHTHTDDCWYIGTGFSCGMTEEEGHVHTDECLGEDTQLGCGMDSTPGHTHSEECYEVLAECPLEEHIHTESCYSNMDADLESDDDWEMTLPDLSDAMTTGEMVAMVAQSQLGYTESTLNFEVDMDGIRRGITRYGQWYGNPYGDWSAMFASFCLHYADTEDLPANAGPESMRQEWIGEDLYQPAEDHAPRIGDIIFLRSQPEEEIIESEEIVPESPDGEEEAEAIAVYRAETDAAVAVAIITDVSEDSVTVIQGDWENAVAERTLAPDDPTILGYGLVPESSPYAVMMMSPRAGELTYLANTINYSADIFTDGRSFVIYAEYDGQYYAIVSRPATVIEPTTEAVPIQIDSNGNIYTDVDDTNSLLWTFTQDGNNGNNYRIRNVSTGRYLHPGNDPGVIFSADWPTALSTSGTGAQFVHTQNDVGIRFNTDQTLFETTTRNNATTLYFGVVEQCTVWLDGSNGGIDSLGGSQNQRYTVSAPSQMTLPTQWLSPTKYHYKLRGWYDVTHNEYYAPGATVTIKEDTVFYADWIADTYDIGRYNEYVAHTVSTDNFVTTQLFDYNYLFNVLSADPNVSVSNSSHSETWSIVRNENVEYENRETLNFIFLDYGDEGTLEYPNNRQDGVNQYPGEDIVTKGIYNADIGQALFSLDDDIPGKYYLGTGDHLFQIMDDPSDPYYGYYYYDSARNAAAYNQSDERFYVYDYLEATSAELTSTKSDFLPLNSPYANTNGQELGTYVPDSEHARYTNYVYDAKYDGEGNSVDRMSTNYAFGMKMDIRFYLPNAPGEEGGNQDVYGHDMKFMFSGDDDLWVLVDGKLALDIGGIHQAETGEINFTTGEVLVQGVRDEALSAVVSALEPGEHTLTVMYLERGGSHSNCAIYFNLAPRFELGIQKEDVLTQDVLNGAQFSVYTDAACTIPAELWESEDSYLNGDPATNVFTVTNGSANMWGMGAGNTYYIRETRAPDKEGYGFPNGIITMKLNKQGVATYSVSILPDAEGISGGFTVHGFRVDEETQQAYIIATNAPEWVEEVTTVETRKFWNDGRDHAGESVTAYLSVRDRDGTVRRLQEAVLSEENDWHHLWENLPKYYEDGVTPVEYLVEEAYVSGYQSTVEKLDDDDTEYTFTSNVWSATTALESGKTYLLRTGSGYLSTLNTGSDTGFMWVDEATAKQSTLAQWTVTTGSGGYKFTNKANQTITFYYNNGNPTDFFASTGGETNAAKQYFRSSVSSGQIRLYYDASTDYYLTASMNSSGKFGYSSSASSALLFTPMTMSRTSTTEPREAEQSYQIINTPLETETSLTVTKEWDIKGGDDPSLYEKSQVTVKLFANGKDTGRTVTLNLKNGWEDTFRGLPYQDEEGAVIRYTVEEIWDKPFWSIDYGEIQTSGGSQPTYSTRITNTYHPGGPELPTTGSFARIGYTLLGSLIMVGSLGWYCVQRRKDERRVC